ncbi:MAG TPA: 6-bladed beta-propeller, partial [Gemmatimonadaceae bacterium]
MRFATLLLLLLACDRQPGGDPSAPEGATPVLHGTVDLTIGGVDEARNAFIFGYVSSLALHPDGRILVADNSTNDIRVFGPDGSYQYTLGRPGAGPGDLNRPCCLAIAADGTLWARDVINRRYSVFALGKDGAEFIRSVRQRVENPRGFLDRVAWDWHGRIVDIGHLGNGLQRAFLDSAGSPVRWDSIPSSPAESLAVMRLERKTAGAVGGVAYYYHYQPHGPVE